MKFLNEITISIFFLILIVLFLDPLMVLMPHSLIYMALGGVVLLFALFANYVWREHSLDEREEMHKAVAGRIGYLVGSGILMVALVAQTLSGHVDTWLVLGLAGMVVGKLAGLAYVRARS